MMEKRSLFSFLFATLAGLGVYGVSAYIVSTNSTYRYPIELWNWGSEMFVFLFPLIVTIPLCWMVFYEKKDGFLKSVHNRISIVSYLLKKYRSILLMAFFATFIASFGSYFLSAWYTFGHMTEFESILENQFLGSFQLESPMVYALLLSLWRSIISCLYVSMGVMFSLLSKNIFVALSATFIYSVLENFITAVLQVPSISAVTSLYPGRLQAAAVSFGSLAIGPAMILMITIGMFFYYRLKTSRNQEAYV